MCCTHYQGEQDFIGWPYVLLQSMLLVSAVVQVDYDQPWTRFIICVNGRKKVFGWGDPKKFDVPQEDKYSEK